MRHRLADCHGHVMQTVSQRSRAISCSAISYTAR